MSATSQQNTAAHTHIASLDGFRAISVLLVIFSHVGYGKFVPGGLGVTIFFFLSGYLITTLLLDEHRKTGAIGIRNFYVRRVCRLLPPMLIALSLAYALTFAGILPGGITPGGVAAQLLYFANYYSIFFDPGSTIPAGTAILWSLAVEEHFYMVYPALMAMLLARHVMLKRIALLFGAVCVAVLAWRYHIATEPGALKIRTYCGTDTRIDSILYGCILALAFNPLDRAPGANLITRTIAPIGMRAFEWSIFIVSMLVLCGTLLFRNPVFHETLRYSLQGMALMPIFYVAIRNAAHFPFVHLSQPLIAKFGVYSYSLYLIHAIVIETVEAHFPGLVAIGPLFTVAVLAISIAFAVAVDTWIDPYFKSLSHRFRGGAVACLRP
jgi:peptidoglycan/LPS O-acetylase OafA/YrhL